MRADFDASFLLPRLESHLRLLSSLTESLDALDQPRVLSSSRLCFKPTRMVPTFVASSPLVESVRLSRC